MDDSLQGEVVKRSQDVLIELWDLENIGEGTLYPSLLDKEAPSGGVPKGFGGKLLFKLRQSEATYKTFLALVLSGVSIRDACGTIGMPANVLQKLAEEGRKYFYRGQDAWQGRLYYDILRARSQARAGAQAVVKKTKPLDWLKNDGDYKNYGETPVLSQSIEGMIDSEPLPDAIEQGAVAADAEMIREAYSHLARVKALPSPETLIKEALAQEGFREEIKTPE